MTLHDYNGNPYVADSKGPVRWKLLCDCGYEFTIDKESFPGRAVARNCNRPECPYTRRKMPPIARREVMGRPMTVEGGAAYTLYLPRHVADAVRQYAALHKLSFSAASAQLILEGALQKLVNE